jgi:hypothetical protein
MKKEEERTEKIDHRCSAAAVLNICVDLASYAFLFLFFAVGAGFTSVCLLVFYPASNGGICRSHRDILLHVPGGVCSAIFALLFLPPGSLSCCRGDIIFYCMPHLRKRETREEEAVKEKETGKEQKWKERHSNSLPHYPFLRIPPISRFVSYRHHLLFFPRHGT